LNSFRRQEVQARKAAIDDKKFKYNTFSIHKHALIKRHKAAAMDTAMNIAHK
jgi:hypothetical protein